MQVEGVEAPERSQLGVRRGANELYGVARRAHRFSSIRLIRGTIALPPKSIAPAAKTFAPAGVS